MAINIIGLDRLLARLDNIAGNEAVMKGIEKGCLKVEASAKELCKVDEGFLRASIDHRLDASTLSGKIFTNAEYAAYKEFGTGIYATKGGGRQDAWTFEDKKGKWHTTVGQKPQPFMYPALQSNIEKIKQDIIDAVKNEIEGV